MLTLAIFKIDTTSPKFQKALDRWHEFKGQYPNGNLITQTPEQIENDQFTVLSSTDVFGDYVVTRLPNSRYSCNCKYGQSNNPTGYCLHVAGVVEYTSQPDPTPGPEITGIQGRYSCMVVDCKEDSIMVGASYAGLCETHYHVQIEVAENPPICTDLWCCKSQYLVQYSALRGPQYTGYCEEHYEEILKKDRSDLFD